MFRKTSTWFVLAAANGGVQHRAQTREARLANHQSSLHRKVNMDRRSMEKKKHQKYTHEQGDRVPTVPKKLLCFLLIFEQIIACGKHHASVRPCQSD